MMNLDVFFTKRFFGYDTEQVDGYIKKLTDAYQTAYDEYNALNGKYKEIKETHENCGNGGNGGNGGGADTDARFAAKTLINAEALAKKLIADAREEASRIIESSERIRTEAQSVKELAFVIKATAEIQAEKLVGAAAAEADRMKTSARSALLEARDLLNTAAKAGAPNGNHAGAKINRAAAETAGGAERLTVYDGAANNAAAAQAGN